MASVLFFFFFFLAFSSTLGFSSAAVYTVGDKQGWTIIGTPNYTAWAAKETFHVGDTLLFVYNKQFHNVVEVKKSDYDSCTGASAIATYATGNDSVTVKTAGDHYFLCGFPGHCLIGQKVKISVSASKTPAPALAPAPVVPPSASTPIPTPAPAPASVVPPSASTPTPVPAPASVVPPSASTPTPASAPGGGATPPSGSGGSPGAPAAESPKSNSAAVGRKGLGLVVFTLVIAACSIAL